jgi:hypothetical protein
MIHPFDILQRGTGASTCWIEATETLGDAKEPFQELVLHSRGECLEPAFSKLLFMKVSVPLPSDNIFATATGATFDRPGNVLFRFAWFAKFRTKEWRHGRS